MRKLAWSAVLLPLLLLPAKAGHEGLPSGLYQGPGHFSGYYGGYLYGYLPGPALSACPPTGLVVCREDKVIDRYVWRQGGFVARPIVSRHCRHVRSCNCKCKSK